MTYARVSHFVTTKSFCVAKINTRNAAAHCAVYVRIWVCCS